MPQTHENQDEMELKDDFYIALERSNPLEAQKRANRYHLKGDHIQIDDHILTSAALDSFE